MRRRRRWKYSKAVGGEEKGGHQADLESFSEKLAMLLKKTEPKLVENVKQALFVPGANCNQLVQNAMADLSALKKPDIKRFNKKNSILPFEDPSTLEFFSEKNDTSLLILGTNNKKRPNNLTFARTFNHKIYDMIELRIGAFKSLGDFRKQTFNVGMKPMFTFQGAAFDDHPVFQQIKSLFLDLFRGAVTASLDVAALQHVISISTGDVVEGQPFPPVLFRVYLLRTYRPAKDSRTPRIELDEIGPRFDFVIGRRKAADADMEKEAFKQAKQLEPKTKKNVETDQMGDQIGRVHVERQDLDKLQTRKMKGLKKRYDQDQDTPSSKKVKT